MASDDGARHPALGQGLVEYECVRADHLGPTRDFTLTVHERAWAFCRAAAPVTPHEWVRREPTKLAELMRPKASGPLPGRPAPLVSLLETARLLSEELDNAIGLRRLVLELARPVHPLVLDLGLADGPVENEAPTPGLDLLLEDEWGAFGVAHLSVPAHSLLTVPAALVAQRICQQFAGSFRADLGRF